MNCPQCSTPLEPNARFCGVCGYRLQPRAAGTAGPGQAGAPPASSAGRAAGPSRGGPPAGGNNAIALGAAGAPRPQAQPQPQGQAKQRPVKPKASKGDEIYINQVLNNRFKIESKIGEGGFGAVYRGVQLATGRKVALKLLHPEMTKDENLVARFRREGMVLCNLRDAHTITTYDFDQTPDGTLYIAMELLEGKSLHQLFHEQAPLEWKRVFKILIEMCSSLAEAHAQGIVHRDLKPENVYLEKRPGNDEFVKILDFGIAKVMRGDAIDPQSPQLTATGQTLGTLEYMSPEQLMGKQLDGRSDVYALGVVAYEMITGRLPFPDAKGPAGLITAQLKQTPQPPSAVAPKASVPPNADRVILKCLEKDKANRFADVTAMAHGLQDVLDAARESPVPVVSINITTPARPLPVVQQQGPLLETRRGQPTDMPPPPAMPNGQQRTMTPPGGSPPLQQAYPGSPGQGQGQAQGLGSNAAIAPPMMQQQGHNLPPALTPHPQLPYQATQPVAGAPYQLQPMQGSGPAVRAAPIAMTPNAPTRWMWWVLGLLVLGAAVGAVAALVFK
jgi:serine/threonine protein kinase